VLCSLTFGPTVNNITTSTCGDLDLGWKTLSCPVSSHSIPYSFSFIFIHFRSSFHSFLFSIHSLVSDSYVLVLVPSRLLSYTSVLVHVMHPSSRPFHMSFVHDRYIVASLFWTCTLLVLHFCDFPVVLFNSLFRQPYSLLVPPVGDQSECALFFQSLIPPIPFLPFTQSSLLQPHSSFWGVAWILGCRNSPTNKIFLCSPRSLDSGLSNSLNEVSVSNSIPNCPCSHRFQQCPNAVTLERVIIPAFLKSENNAVKKKTNPCWSSKKKKKITTCFKNSCAIRLHMQTVSSATSLATQVHPAGT